MSDKPINLRRARKSRARAEARQKVDENAVRHGRNRAERERASAEARHLAEHLDRHRLDRE